MSESKADLTLHWDDRVAVITIDRPPVNAFRTATWEALERACQEARDRARALVIRSGTPGIFSAGADVKELPMTPERDAARQALSRRVLEAVLRFPVPVICAIDGPALGSGCAIASVADIRHASESARLGLPEINVGRCGGARFLMRHLPQGLVREMYFTGRSINASDALRHGLVNAVHPDGDALDAHVAQLAAEIASKSPTAVRLAKQSLDLAEQLPLEQGYEVEQQFSLRLATSPDADEAAAAFREKRPPRWKD